MGSRAVVLLCRDDGAAATQFGATAGETGAIYTRTGRSFFNRHLTEQLLAGLRNAADTAGLWSELDTDWMLLDAELLPWSAKADELLREQYAAVGAAATAVLSAATAGLEHAASRGIDVSGLLDRTRARSVNARLSKPRAAQRISPSTSPVTGSAFGVPTSRASTVTYDRPTGLAST